MSKKKNSSKAAEIEVTPDIAAAVLKSIHRTLGVNSYFSSAEINRGTIEKLINKRCIGIACGAAAHRFVLDGTNPKDILRWCLGDLRGHVAGPDLGSLRNVQTESLLNLVEPILSGAIPVTGSLFEDDNALSHAVEKASKESGWTERAAGVLVEAAWELQRFPENAAAIIEHAVMRYTANFHGESHTYEVLVGLFSRPASQVRRSAEAKKRPAPRRRHAA